MSAAAETAPRPKKPPLRRRLRMHWRGLVNEHTSSTRLGVAIGLGVFLGASPFYGFQILLCVLLAMVLRLNKLAMLAGAQISAPPMTPFLVFASIQLGERLTTGHWLSLDFAELRGRPTGEVVAESALSFATGATLIAVVLGLSIGYASARVIAAQRARAKTSTALPDAERDALLIRAEALPRSLESYIGWKTRLDPVYAMVLPLLEGRRAVVDLGAGPGVLAALLAARAPQCRIRSVEWDEKKTAAAKTLCAELPNVQVEQGDARTVDLGTPDAVVLLDVLHYHPKDAQLAWVDRVAQALAPGGALVLRELERRRGGRSPLSERLEQFAVRIGWNKGPGVTPLAIEDLIDHLQQLGLACETRPCGEGMFSSNVLVVARKPDIHPS